MFGVLAVIAVILIMVILVQIGKVVELSSQLKDEAKADAASYNWQGILLGLFLVVGFAAMTWSVFKYDEFFLPEAASEHGGMIDNMFMWTLVATGIVFIITHILLFWYAMKYRHKEGRKVKYYPDDNKLELIWTAVPAVVMFILVGMGLSKWYKITGPAPEGSMIIEATGKQFEWIIRYPGNDGELGGKDFRMINLSNNILGQDWSDERNHDDFIAPEIHLIKGKPVIVKINAQDVLHNFYLPHFRTKLDAVPGMPTQLWFTPNLTTAEARDKYGNEEFNFELACAELCGKGHFSMKKIVIVETEEEYNAWLATQKSYYEQVGKGGQAAVEEVEAEETEEELLSDSSN
jgi:cytochrome c oxidase subunit 2